jgi:hypothetical protein
VNLRTTYFTPGDDLEIATRDARVGQFDVDDFVAVKASKSHKIQ